MAKNALGFYDHLLGKDNSQIPHWYAWTNFCEGFLRKMSHLDHFYISPNCHILPSHVGLFIHIDLLATLSYHLPIHTTLVLTDSPPLPNEIPHKLNISHLTCQDCIDGLLAIWKAKPKPRHDR